MSNIHQAALKNDIAAVREAISHGVDINKLDVEGLSPLHYAIMQYGVFKTIDGEAILVPYDKSEIVRVLLEEGGASLNLKNKSGYTPLQNAVSKNLPDIVEILIAHGADIMIGEGESPFWMAMLFNKPKVFDVILKSHEGQKILKAQGELIINKAAFWNDPAIIKSIFEADKEGNIVKHHLKIMVSKHLRGEHKSDLLEKHGDNLLKFAVGPDCKTELAKILLDSHVSPTLDPLENVGGITAMHMAAGNQCTNIMQNMVDRKYNIEIQDNFGRTPLFYSAFKIPTQLVKTLNAFPQEEKEHMYFSANAGLDQLGAFGVLMKSGADTKAVDKEGSTPLHYASKYANTFAAMHLINKGLAIDVTNKQDQTPIDLGIKPDPEISYIQRFVLGKEHSVKSEIFINHIYAQREYSMSKFFMDFISQRFKGDKLQELFDKIVGAWGGKDIFVKAYGGAKSIDNEKAKYEEAEAPVENTQEVDIAGKTDDIAEAA